MSRRSTDRFIGSAISTIVILTALHLIDVGSCSRKDGTTKEAQEESGPKTEGELCTCTTNGNPWYYLEVYAVGHGHGQKLRRDIFGYGKYGMQPIDHTIVVSGITYFWNEEKNKDTSMLMMTQIYRPESILFLKNLSSIADLH